MSKIKIGIIGLGNCASSLIQGIEYYKDEENDIGLMNKVIGGYKPDDIEVVLAFDIDKRKVGFDISEAIFNPPNCTKVFYNDIPNKHIFVEMGRVLDGIAEHMKYYYEYDTFIKCMISKEPTKEQVIKEIKNCEVDIMINYLPVGAIEATKFYTNCILEAKVGMVNCIPVFMASSTYWEQKFKKNNIPIIGDDIKSQLGATIIHRVLTNIFEKRGVQLNRTYQLNVGGNTDFLNMLDRSRISLKKQSKTEAVQSQLKNKLEYENIRIGPSDWIPWLNDNKICFIRMEGNIFGDIPIDLELRLSVQDGPNSAGIVIDAIRCCKLALDNNIGGALIEPSSYFMKHPPIQYTDDESYKLTKDFINEMENIKS